MLFLHKPNSRTLRAESSQIPSDTMNYTIEIASSFADFWQYNIAVTCGCFDADNRQIGFVPAESTIAPVGSNLDKCPAGTPSHRRLTFTAPDCDHLRMYVYIIPHTLPTEKQIADCRPFPLTVKVAYAGKPILHEKRDINRWSGASIELTASRASATDADGK